MGKQAGERDDERGGLGASAPQDGPTGGEPREDAGGSADGEGAQRHPGGSSRDSEKQR